MELRTERDIERWDMHTKCLTGNKKATEISEKKRNRNQENLTLPSHSYAHTHPCRHMHTLTRTHLQLEKRHGLALRPEARKTLPMGPVRLRGAIVHSSRGHRH